MNENVDVAGFWELCRAHVDGLPEQVPPAWAFGATPAHADSLLALVVEGAKLAPPRRSGTTR
ncbi:hypothetical protein [Leucobacter coleopterorum]|uniref:hypothetical protein n=1 Tax=Leucobacter coleopterorum TaxID=2714933 RepID=UPI003137B071